MRFVAVKSREQQAALSMHRTRDLLVKQRTQCINMMRGLLAEFGINIPKGTPLVYELDADLRPLRHYYLGDQEAIAASLAAVANQGKAN